MGILIKIVVFVILFWAGLIGLGEITSAVKEIGFWTIVFRILLGVLAIVAIAVTVMFVQSHLNRMARKNRMAVQIGVIGVSVLLIFVPKPWLAPNSTKLESISLDQSISGLETRLDHIPDRLLDMQSTRTQDFARARTISKAAENAASTYAKGSGAMISQDGTNFCVSGAASTQFPAGWSEADMKLYKITFSSFCLSQIPLQGSVR